MGTELLIFEHVKFKNIRGLLIDGQPWLVAKDVCRNLELKNVTQALKRLDKDELTSFKMMSGGQRREMNLVNEPGLYRLIFSSRKKEALEFQRWVYHEVLPAIRKTGSFSIDAQPTQNDDMQTILHKILEVVKAASNEKADMRALLLEIRAVLLSLIDAVNSSNNAEKILSDLAEAFNRFAQEKRNNGDFERGKVLAKLVFALKASPKKEQLAFTAANLVMGEKAF